MENKNFKSTFAKSIEEYLLSIKSEDESLKRNYDNFQLNKCQFFTDTGIKRINIPPKKYICAFYFDKIDNIHEVYDLMSEDKYVITNLNRREVNSDFKMNNIIFIDELPKNIDYKEVKLINIDSKNKNKCLPITEMYRYIKYLMRTKIISAIFSNEFIGPTIEGINQTNSLLGIFPFEYSIKDIKCIFYEDRRSIEKLIKKYDEFLLIKIIGPRLRNEYLYDEKYFFNINVEYTSINKTHNGSFINEFLNIVDQNQKYYIQKINYEYLTTLIDVYTNGASYLIDDFSSIYKYRQFEKIRYDKEESISYLPVTSKHHDSLEICIGSRTAIENNSIWFSSSDSLNDPFDLKIRVPKSLKIIKELDEDVIEGDNYASINYINPAVFCATEENDNILMWSHYGDSHKGMCTLYYQNELLDKIASDKDISLCIYGKVKYSSKRPEFQVTMSALRFISVDTIFLIFNITNLFTKYNDWKYEKEKRFVLFPNSMSNDAFANGHGLTLNAKKYKFGANFNSKLFNDYLNYFGIKLDKYKISDKDFKLV